MKHIIRFILTFILLGIVFANAHWSVGLSLTLITLEAEISALLFVRKVSKITLEKRT